MLTHFLSCFTMFYILFSYFRDFIVISIDSYMRRLKYFPVNENRSLRQQNTTVIH